MPSCATHYPWYMVAVVLTPNPVPPSRPEEVANLLRTARRHEKGLGTTLDELERVLLGRSTVAVEQTTDKKS